jgi:hypothetical protein
MPSRSDQGRDRSGPWRADRTEKGQIEVENEQISRGEADQSRRADQAKESRSFQAEAELIEAETEKIVSEEQIEVETKQIKAETKQIGTETEEIKARQIALRYHREILLLQSPTHQELLNYKKYKFCHL